MHVLYTACRHTLSLQIARDKKITHTHKTLTHTSTSTSMNQCILMQQDSKGALNADYIYQYRPVASHPFLPSLPPSFPPSLFLPHMPTGVAAVYYS